MARRRFLRLATSATAGGALLSVAPAVLYRPPWSDLAAAQTLPTVEATFIALVETVNATDPGDDTTRAVARWIVAEFDRALPPLPEGSPSAAVAAILDAYTLQTGNGPTFATTDDDGRLAALEAMVKDDSPDIRQVANQVLPFATFAYWSDVALDEPAAPGGPRLDQWERAGFLGPSDDRLDHYEDGTPEGFAASPDREEAS